MKLLLIILAALICLPALAQNHSRKYLIKNGVYAATFIELSADSGKVNGYQLVSPRAVIGLQLYRFKDWVSIGLGYGKVGFQQPRNQDTKDNRFRYDYNGPRLHLSLLPGRLFGLEFASYIRARGKGSEEIADVDQNLSYEYRVDDMNLSLNIRVYKEIRFLVGLGQRTFKYDAEISNSATATLPSTRQAKGNESGGYLYLGLKASQF